MSSWGKFKFNGGWLLNQKSGQVHPIPFGTRLFPASGSFTQTFGNFMARLGLKEVVRHDEKKGYVSFLEKR